MKAVALTINGRAVSESIEPRMHLADLLRERQQLTGTHLGCEHGVCGACTLLIDGVPARSCITFAVACAGAQITTIEGLDDDEITAELRAAFSKEHALQCGFCTPGMIISARDLVLRAETPDEHDIRVAMSGNLCRCTGYVGIIRAIRLVIADRRARGIAAIVGGGRTTLGPVGARPGADTLPALAAARTKPPETMVSAPKFATARSFTPHTVVEKSFTVAYPRDAVWAFFLRPSAVAACLPGASLTGESDDQNVTGKLRVKVGPIVADFHGAAEITRDPAAFTGSIIGSGIDGRSRSTAEGEIGYSLLAESPLSTRVNVTIGYTLTGTLAQFSRSRLVQDIVDRLTTAFVANLQVALADGGDTSGSRAAPAELNAGGLLLSVIAGRLKAWLRRLLGS